MPCPGMIPALEVFIRLPAKRWEAVITFAAEKMPGKENET